MQVLELLKFLDFEDENLVVDDEAYDGLANALRVLGVRQDDIEYLGTKMTGMQERQKQDMEFLSGLGNEEDDQWVLEEVKEL